MVAPRTRRARAGPLENLKSTAFTPQQQNLQSTRFPGRHSLGGTEMLFTIAAILIVLWLLGFVVFHVSGALIHLLLVIAIVVGLVQLFRGRRV
jgi:hypothetical protein